MVFTIFYGLATIAGLSVAQVFDFGRCNPDLPTAKNFDNAKYYGRWYEIKRSFVIPDQPNKCYIVLIEPSEGNVFNVNSYSMTKKHQGTWNYHTSGAYYDDDVQNGKLKRHPGLFGKDLSFWILDTDYDNYALQYFCVDINEGKLEYAAILGRTVTLDRKWINRGLKFLKINNITMKLYPEKHDCGELDVANVSIRDNAN